MRNLATTILELWIKVVSKDTRNVGSVCNDSMVTTSYTPIVEIDMNDVTYVIEGMRRDSSSTIKTTMPWRNIFEEIIFCVPTRNVWRRSSWSLSRKWIFRPTSLRLTRMDSLKTQEEMREESTFLDSIIEHRTRKVEEVEQIAVAEQEEEEEEIPIRKHCRHQQLSQCVETK